MKILITGCAGFIGARSTQLALDAGHDVVAYDEGAGEHEPEEAYL